MGKRQQIVPIISGLVAILLILFLLSLFLTLLLQFTSIRESSLHWFIMPLTMITLLIGGMIAGYRAGGNGWYFGGITGIAFILLSWLTSFLGFEIAITTKQLVLYALYLLVTIVGGVIGVNISPQQSA